MTYRLARAAPKVLATLVCTGLLLGFALTRTAQAQVTGQVWEGIPDSGNAGDAANRAAGLANATFTSTGINYCSNFSDLTCTSHPYDVSDFLNNPTFSNQMNGFNPTATMNNTEVQLSSTIFLNAGANSFNIGHDDGLTLLLSGGPGTTNCSTQSGALCVNQPGPTGPTVTAFTITASATGLYNFTLDYAECCGPPATLQWTFPNGAPVGAAPEPATWMMFAAGLLGVGRFVRAKIAL